jgi:hypothetical protein
MSYKRNILEDIGLLVSHENILYVIPEYILEDIGLFVSHDNILLICHSRVYLRRYRIVCVT